MSNEDKIIAHLESLPDDSLMSDACARVVASLWHGGQSSALYALQSSGAITDGVAGEIVSELDVYTSSPDHPHTLELGALLTYVTEHGQRGPVAGWSDLWL